MPWVEQWNGQGGDSSMMEQVWVDDTPAPERSSLYGGLVNPDLSVDANGRSISDTNGQWKQYADGSYYFDESAGGYGKGSLLSRALRLPFDTLAKVPGSAEAFAKGINAGFSGDASWNPFDEEASVWDIGAGGTELSQDPRNRQIGRAIGTAIGAGFAAPALAGAMGGGTAGAAGAGALTSAGTAALQPGATWESVLKAGAIGGLAGGIKGYLSTDGTIKQLPSNLGDPLPTDFADIAYDPASAPITDFPSLSGDMPGVPSSELGNFNPGGAFVGPPELAGMPEGTPDINYSPTPGGSLPPADYNLGGTGQIPGSDGTSGFAPLSPIYSGDSGPIPENPRGPDPLPEIAPEPEPLPEIPGASSDYSKYAKLIASMFKNGGSGGGSGAGGGYGSQDKLARSLRRVDTPVTTTNPNYIPR